MCRILILTPIAAALFALSCGTAPKDSRRPASSDAAQTKSGVRITQFYAAEPHLARGEKTKLCYGVENAKTVHLTPAAGDVWPAFVRCIDIAPAQSIDYTLTAEDGGGHSTSQIVHIEVGPPAPKILDMTINKLAVSRGEPIQICYQARNAVTANISPGAFRRPPDPNRGCLTDNPKQTTTYELKITGAGGRVDTEKVTVTVK